MIVLSMGCLKVVNIIDSRSRKPAGCLTTQDSSGMAALLHRQENCKLRFLEFNAKSDAESSSAKY